MKKYILLFLLFVGVAQNSNACIDPNPDAIQVSWYLDSTNCKAILQVCNLQIMGGNPNQFCSCAVNNFLNGMGDITYVVFVDSVTHEPVVGFDQFANNSFANNAWDEAAGEYDWNGFVSDVNDAGLIAGQSVYLWIHIDMSDFISWGEFEFNPCDDIPTLIEYASNGAIGTDEWDNDANDLSEDHQSIANFNQNSNAEWILVDADGIAYFDNIVENYYSTLSVDKNSKDEFAVYPNPTSSILIFNVLPNSLEEVIIYNSLGELVLKQLISSISIDIENLSPGIYHLQTVGLKEEYLKTFIKM